VAVAPGPTGLTTDCFVLKQKPPERSPELEAADEHAGIAVDVRAELATPTATPPRAVIAVKRDKRQVSPGMLTANGA
jgi:hypothetical protein